MLCPATKTYNFIIESLTYFLIVFSPLIYGSVQLLPLTILESVIFLILFIWLIRAFFTSQPFIKTSIWIPILLFVSLVFFQLIPLPKPVLSLFSCHRAYLINEFISNELICPTVFSLTIYRNQTIARLLELLSYAGLFFVLVNYLETKGQFKRLVLVIISMCFLVAILGMSKGFKYPFVNRNHFAGYMEMVIPLTIGYLLTDIIKPKKIIFAFIVIIMILGLFLSLSRAGILCFLGSIIFMLFALRLKKTLKGKIAFIYMLILISSILIVIMGIAPLLERFGALFREEIFNRESRLRIWLDTLRIIKDFFLFGSGLGTFRNIYPMYKTLSAQVIVNHAHSDFLQLISETGIVGLSIVIWFLILFFREAFLGWFKRHHHFAKGITLGGLTGVLAILLHSFFDFNLQIPANALLFTIIMALTYKSVITDFNENGVS